VDVSALHLPWLELAVVIPLAGSIWIGWLRDPDAARVRSLVVMGAALLCAAGAWIDYHFCETTVARDGWDMLSRLTGSPVLVLDAVSAPLLPLGALLYFLTALSTARTKARRFSFATALLAEAILLATVCCREPWGVIALLALGTVPPGLELAARGRPTRLYGLHMALFVGLLAGGWWLLQSGTGAGLSSAGIAMLIAAVLLRSGIAPFHTWVPQLFEHATFGTALLTVTPMLGAYAAVRLVLPIAPDWALRSIAVVSLATAVYAAGMALVQREARRFFCYLFLSHSALVLVGLETATPISLTGALSLWLSVGLALGGFGLTLRSMEARAGRLSLDRFHGYYQHTPLLAAFFLLTGLASVGFPGTFGFVGTELLVEGAVQAFPLVGVTVVIAAALNGIAVLQVYFRVFTGTRHASTISLRGRPRERIGVLALTVLILGGGLFPQWGIQERHEAAIQIVRSRRTVSSDRQSAADRSRHVSTFTLEDGDHVQQH
jgi:NADH-quinone oxidoreductase subunit M